MIKWLKKIKFKLFLKAYYRTHKITERGKMILYYILNKYINITKPTDFIESYEVSIARFTQEFMDKARTCVEMLPEKFADVDKEEKIFSIAHVFAAMYLFEILMISIPAPQREEWFDRINDPTIRAGIRESIKTHIG